MGFYIKADRKRLKCNYFDEIEVSNKNIYEGFLTAIFQACKNYGELNEQTRNWDH